MTDETHDVMDDVSPAEAEHGAEHERDEAPRLVPVTESIRYRRRAQAAEQRAAELEAKVGTVQQELDEARRQLQAMERRQRIDQLLVESQAIDLEAARLLTEAAVSVMDEPDVQSAVSELRRRRPYLFRRGVASSGGAMSPGPRPGAGRAEALDDAATEAAVSGDRRDLLRYLRLRRTAG